MGWLIASLGFYHQTPAEDFDLWMRALMITDIDNLPDILLLYRLSPNSIVAKTGASLLHDSSIHIQKTISALLQRDIALSDVQKIWIFSSRSFISQEEIKNTARLIIDIYHAYIKLYSFPKNEKQHITYNAASKLFALCADALKYSPQLAVDLFLKGWRFAPLSPFITLLTAISRRIR